MQVVLLETDLAAVKEEDRQRSRLLGDMAAQRDRQVSPPAYNTQWDKICSVIDNALSGVMHGRCCWVVCRGCV